MVSSQEEMEAIFSNHYQQVYHTLSPSTPAIEKGTCGVGRKVTSSMNEALMKCFTKEEVEAALHQMAPLKSPGSDGLNPNFYQTY